MSDDASSKLNTLKRKFENFTREVRLSSIESEINEISQSARSLPEQIKKVRDRGYAFRSYLEHKAEVIENHWEDIKHRVQNAIETESAELRADYEDAEKKLEAAERVADSPDKLMPRLEMLEPIIERLEQGIDDAKKRIREIYSTLQTDISKTESQLREIAWFCDLKDEATFAFLAGESLFLAAKAEWDAGKDKPNGILFLSDQRLMFEQKETTGKKLGLFGGKKEQGLQWEVPLNTIEKVEWENKGLFGGKDMLHFALGSGAPYSKITVEVKGADNKFWVKQIDRMMKGETNDERAIQPDAEMLEAVRNAPTECHVCGGTLPKVVANQNQLDCMYCGAVVRL